MSDQLVDVVISDMPLNVYHELRKQLMAKGYHTQSYQKGFYQNTNKKEIY